MIELIGFCPLISQRRVRGNFVFTIAPYMLPDFFSAKSSIDYFTFEEASKALQDAVFVKSSKGDPSTLKDSWSEINHYRRFVTSSLNAGLSDILSRGMKKEGPIIEIGSAAGYSTIDEIASKTIRIQPNTNDCRLLERSIPFPVYQLDIDGLYHRLTSIGKKIPLFFSLNVFDVLPSDVRKKSWLQLSKLQNPGDRIIVMLDTNPCLNRVWEQLTSLHPGYVVVPYFPLVASKNEKMAVLLLPSELMPPDFSFNDALGLVGTEKERLAKTGRASELQHRFHTWREKFNLKVIVLEDFFADQLKAELAQVGYQTNAYYHTSFTTGKIAKGAPIIEQDLMYKAVTDSLSVRQWKITDRTLIESLAKKNIALPDDFDAAFLDNLRAEKQKIFGAEILVIEAALLHK